MKQRSKAEYLYVHVPFCASICSYCDFCHQIYQKETVDKWLNALKMELDHVQPRKDLKTIYLGGGTPTCLDESQLEKLLSLLDEYTSVIREYTIEVNPETLTKEKAEILRKHRINRASIGLQSIDESLLKLMGRRHSFVDVKNTVNLLRKEEITNISLDIMYSLPGQTMESLKETIEFACLLDVTHLSCYSLTIEDNTVFGKKGYQHLEDDLEADMYEFICMMLIEHGFQQYEISNFSKEGFESIHNKAYWHYDDFVGLGCGASGKEGLLRYDHEKSVKNYLSDPLKRIEIQNTKEDAMFEMVMMGLRLKEGISFAHFQEIWNVSLNEVYGKPIRKLETQDLLYEEDGYLKTTNRGFEILNTVLEEFL